LVLYFRLMKAYLIAILFLTSLLGCKKEAPPPAVSPNTEYLTAKTWLYGEYYSGYGTPNQKRMYKRNNPGNAVDFTDYGYTFKKDGSFVVTIGTESLQGSWKFINNETGIEITSDTGSPTVLTIKELSKTSFDWVMNEYYAKMIPH
jgi:hypothetical protein